MNSQIRSYARTHNWKMAIHLLILHVKLWWPVKCDCPFNDNFHRVEIMYWPRTAYHWNEKGIDPNGPMICCKDMADECVEYWDGMWVEYYNQVR